MPRSAYRFIKPLSKAQEQRVKHIRDTGRTKRIRHRAHAILLSQDGREIREIAEIFQVDRNTVSNWLDRWDSFCLVTPNWTLDLPGFPYRGDDPDGFILRDQIAEYVLGYRAFLDAPVLE